MRTSEKRILPGVVRFLAAFVIVNAVLTFILTPYSSPSREMWRTYRARADETIDVVFAGTSQCYEGINPKIVDPVTGLSSQNMGTNAESFKDSRRAIETAILEHHISYAVLIMDYWYLMDGMERYAKPEAAFIYAQNMGQPLTERVKNGAGFVFDKRYFAKPESVAFFFPWLNNQNKYPRTIPQNMLQKLGLKKVKATNTNYIRNKEGFKSFDGELDYNTDDRQKKQHFSPEEISDESRRILLDLCGLCREHHTKLIVIGAPTPASYVLSYGDDYFKRMEYVRSFFAQQGVTFVDLNMATEEFYPREPSDFRDWDHVNNKGAVAFSNAAAQILKAEMEGTPIRDLFYSKEEYLASIDYIDTVDLKVKSSPEAGFEIRASSYQGSGVTPEYAFAIRKAGEKGFIRIRGYSQDPVFVWKPEKAGNYKIRVYARVNQAAKNGRGEKRYFTRQASYWTH